MPIDWSKAGVRIKRTPYDPARGGRNPDWDMRHDRWKDEADYAGEAMTHGEVAARVACPSCKVIVGRFCHTVHGDRMEQAHFQRIRLAGEQAVAEGATTTTGGNDG